MFKIILFWLAIQANPISGVMIPCLRLATLCAHILMVSAGAPEDRSPFCTEELLSYEEVPALPSHAAVLMDSYHYNVLLGDEGSGGVWQHVDLDTNNIPGRNTEVRGILTLHSEPEELWRD